MDNYMIINVPKQSAKRVTLIVNVKLRRASRFVWEH